MRSLEAISSTLQSSLAPVLGSPGRGALALRNRAGDAGQSGPLTAHPLRLPPGETRTVTGLVLEGPRGRPPRAGEVLLVELQIVTGGGGYFAIVVGEFAGR